MEKTKFCQNSIRIERNTDNLINIFVTFYILVIFLILVLPCMKYTVPYELVAALTLLGFPFFFFSGNQQKYLCILFLCSLLFGLIYLVVKIPGDLKESMNEMIRNLRFYLPAAIGFYAVRHLKDRSKNLLLYSFFLLVFYIMLVTIVALYNDPMLARSLAEGVTIADSTAAYRMANVGGFEFSYMIGMLTLVFVFSFVHSAEKINKFLSLLAAVLCFYYILESQYTILLLLTTVFCVIQLCWRRSNLLLKIILILGMLLFLFNIDNFFLYLSQHMKQQMLAEKFSWIGDYYSGNSAVEALHSRPSLYLDAISDFFKSPIWGSNTDSSDRAHSYVLGLLSSGGLLGLFCYLTIFFEAKKHIETCLISLHKDCLLFRYACWYCFILSILNPIGTSFEITILLYLIIPIWISNRDDAREIGRKT